MTGKQSPTHITRPPAMMAETYEKRRLAAELRRSGKSWDKVAAGSGYADKGSASNAVKALLREHQSLAYEEIALYRQESLDRLTALLGAVWERAMNGDDKAVTQVRLLISQIGDLTGEKAPVKVEIGESDVDRLLRDAQEQFAQRVAELDRKASGVQADPGTDR